MRFQPTPRRHAARRDFSGPAGLLLALLLLALPVQAQPAAAPSSFVYPGPSWARLSSPEAIGYTRAGLDSLRLYVETLETDGLLVTVGGRVLFEYGDLDTLSYLASVRKSILAMLYGKPVTEGTIQLDKTLQEIGMDDEGGLLPIEREATIDHLITARSGVYHVASNPGDNLADAPARGSQTPGTYFLYSNWDFNAAGAAFERETGRDIYDALEADLARPLSMQDFDRQAQRKSGDLDRSRYQAYHMWLSTRDMARLGYLMLREGEWAGEQVIPKNWAEQIVSIVTPVEEMNPAHMRAGPFGYGYMWWVWDGPTATGPYEGAYSARGAWGQYITVLPALDLVIAHKTIPRRIQRRQDYARVSVSWDQFQGIMDLLLAARCTTNCMDP